MVQDLGYGSREKPNLDGQPLKAALGGNALGKVAAWSFIVCIFQPYKSSRQLKTKRKKEKAGKAGLEEAVGGEGYTVDFRYTGSSLIWMDLHHSKMILHIHLNGTDFLYACYSLKILN